VNQTIGKLFSALIGGVGLWTVAIPAHAQPGVTWSLLESAHVSAQNGPNAPGLLTNATAQYTTAGGLTFNQNDPSAALATVPTVLTPGFSSVSLAVTNEGSSASAAASLSSGATHIFAATSYTSLGGGIFSSTASTDIQLSDMVTFHVAGGGAATVTLGFSLDGSLSNGSPSEWSYSQNIEYKIGTADMVWLGASGAGGGPTFSGTSGFITATPTNDTINGFSFLGTFQVNDGQVLPVFFAQAMSCSNSATCNFVNTGQMSLTLPTGVTYSSASGVFLTQTQGAPGPMQFYSVTPCRMVDTRVGQGKTSFFGPPSMAANSTRNFPLLAAGCSIPSTAEAYSLNFTVVPEGPLGYVSVWAQGNSYPGVSTLNSSDGSTIANAAIVPAGESGGITVLTSNATDLIIDVNGYFAPAGTSSLDFFPLTPCRIADTRATQPFTGLFGPPSLVANTGRNIPVGSSPCLSGSAAAYSLNMTVVPDGTLGFLSVWPAGQPFPVVSTLNSPDGTTLANAAILPAGSSGAVDVLASNATDLIIDINGTFSSPATGGLQFYPLTPCRVADTRSSQPFTEQFGPPSLVANAGRNFPIQASPCGIPATAAAYALNLTVVPTGALSFLSVWPQGEPYPGVSTLNSPDGFVIANAAIVPAGTVGNGGITVLPGNATDLIIDIVGYFAP
jgi:hypothetical protein